MNTGGGAPELMHTVVGHLQKVTAGCTFYTRERVDPTSLGLQTDEGFWVGILGHWLCFGSVWQQAGSSHQPRRVLYGRIAGMVRLGSIPHATNNEPTTHPCAQDDDRNRQLQ
jgi:hypothetical protein